MPDLRDDRVSKLELKVPPDVVALALAGVMWLVSRVTPSLAVPLAYRVLVAGVLFIAAIALVATARAVFARAGTTFNPTDPDRSSHLVTAGVYRLSRNPMYLGTLLALLAVAALLSNPFSLILSAAFVAYMDRFQIAPEERVLGAKFGPAYDAYADRVRRWL
jgi:protein-S-isoprenylcysteine O-methyltransferase Ste14